MYLLTLELSRKGINAGDDNKRGDANGAAQRHVVLQ